MQMPILSTFLDNLEEFPEAINEYSSILKVINSSDISQNDFISILSSEDKLKTKILEFCNSSYFNLNKKVPGIAIAYNIIGKETLKSLTLLSTLKLDLFMAPLLGYNYKEKMFWQHCFICGVCSKYLAEEISYEFPEDAFMAGILHDIGKLILNNHHLPAVIRAWNLTAVKGYKIWEAEEAVLGLSHQEISSKIVLNWGLGENIANGIKYHHTPEKLKENNLLASILNAANVITLILTQGKQNYYLQWVPEETLNILNLTNEDLIDIISNIGSIVDYAWKLFEKN